MAEIQIDVNLIEDAIAEQLRGLLGASVPVLVEAEVGAFQPGNCVIIYLDRFTVDGMKQTLSAGKRQDEDLSLTIWCFHTGIELQGCRTERNKLHRLVKRGVLTDRTFGGKVLTTYVNGGEYQTLPRTEPGFTMAASIEIMCETRMSIE